MRRHCARAGATMSRQSWWCTAYEELESSLTAVWHPDFRTRCALPQGAPAAGRRPHAGPPGHCVPAVARSRHRRGCHPAGRPRAPAHGHVPLSARHAARECRRRRDRPPKARTAHTAVALAAHCDGPDVPRHPLLEPHRQARRLPVHHGDLLRRRALPAHSLRHRDRRQPQLARARAVFGAAVGIWQDPHRPVPARSYPCRSAACSSCSCRRCASSRRSSASGASRC